MMPDNDSPVSEACVEQRHHAHHDAPYLPTPEEIAVRAGFQRMGWSQNDYAQRRGGVLRGLRNRTGPVDTSYLDRQKIAKKRRSQRQTALRRLSRLFATA